MKQSIGYVAVVVQDYDKAIHQVLKNVSSLAILGEYKKGELRIQNQ